jgi:hypothetical protein
VARNSKYPLNLTTEDKRILDYAIIRFVAEFYVLIQKYPNPKDYAKKVIIRNSQSDKRTALMCTVTYSRSFPAGHIFTPAELNRRLISDLRRTIEKGYNQSVKGDSSYTERFLHPRDLREGVLEVLERRGMLIHMETVGLIRGRRRSTLRGRRSSTDVNDYRGGRLSEYEFSEVIKKIQKFVEKPGAVEYFYRGTLNSGLAHRLATYNILAGFHAVMLDEKTFHRVTAVGASFMETDVREEKLKIFFQVLRRFSDKQLEEYTEIAAKQLLRRRKYHQGLLFMVLSLTCSGC